MPDLTLTISNAKFRIGQNVLKVGRYEAFGKVVGFAIGERGNLVYVVEHKAQIAGHFMHLYDEGVLRYWGQPPEPVGESPQPEPPPPEPILVNAERQDSFDPQRLKKAARARGFTGSFCEGCGGFNCVRTGTCETCSDCGWNKGCG